MVGFFVIFVVYYLIMKKAPKRFKDGGPTTDDVFRDLSVKQDTEAKAYKEQKMREQKASGMRDASGKLKVDMSQWNPALVDLAAAKAKEKMPAGSNAIHSAGGQALLGKNSAGVPYTDWAQDPNYKLVSGDPGQRIFESKTVVPYGKNDVVNPAFPNGMPTRHIETLNPATGKYVLNKIPTTQYQATPAATVTTPSPIAPAILNAGTYQADLNKANQMPTVKPYKKGGLVGKIRGYDTGGEVQYDRNGKPIPTQLQNTNSQSKSSSAPKAMNTDATVGAINTGVDLTTGLIDASALDAETGLYGSKSQAAGVGALKGAAAGATAGMAFGPYGALIGGAVGGLAGGTTGYLKEKKGEDALALAKAENKAAIDSQKQKELFNAQMQKSMQQRQEGYADGGKIKGPGGPKEDKIIAKVKGGSFIVPAKNAELAEEVREKVLKAPSMKKANLNQKGGETVKLSNGEHMFSPQEVEEIEKELGDDFLDKLAPEAAKHEDMMEGEHGEKEGKANGGRLSAEKAKMILHDGTANGKPLTDRQRRYMGWVAGGSKEHAEGGSVGCPMCGKQSCACGGKVKGYSDGGKVKGATREYRGETVTFDGKNWVTKDGSVKYKGDIFDEDIKKESAKKAEEDAKYNASQIDALKRHYEFIKDKPDRKAEAERTLAKLNSFSETSKIPTKTGAEITTITGTKKAPVISKNKVTPEVMQTKTTELPVNNKEADIIPSGENTQGISQTSPATQKTGMSPAKKQALINAGLSAAQRVGGLANYVLPYKQYQLGQKFLNEAGARPVGQIDPGFQESVTRANANAKYGWSPEEQALNNQANLNALRAQQAAAQNYSGGSAGNAYVMSRQASNDYFGRGLQNAVANKNLMMDKQSYADQLNSQKAAMSRQLFQDSMNAWNQKQQSGAALLGAGLSNLMGAKRYNDEANFQRELANNQNDWTNTIGQ